MGGPVTTLMQGQKLLVAVAAPAEAEAVRAGLHLRSAEGVAKAQVWLPENVAPGIDLLETGVGKVNAAAGVVRAMQAGGYGGVLNLGICGALCPLSQLGLESVVVGATSAYADEGVWSAAGFRSLPELGFPFGPFPGSEIAGDPRLLSAVVEAAAPIGPLSRGGIATVSTCSGTDALASEIAKRTGAIAEAMEGAAIAHVLARLHPSTPFAEVRVVSNSTGDRTAQVWDIRGALKRLADLAALVLR